MLHPKAPRHRRRQLVLAGTSGLVLGLVPLTSGWAQRAAPASATDPYAEIIAEGMRFGWLGRSDVQTFITDVAERYAIPRSWIEAQFRDAGAQPRAVSLMNPPPPKPGEPVRKRSWARYRSQHADAARIDDGRAFLREHRDVFDAVQKTSGVPATVIAGIIGVETKYGKFMGRYPVLETLATLAFDSPRRNDFFRQELESLLIMGRQGTFDLKNIKGSFAGAMGLPQFMPSSWRSYAIGYAAKERVDLFNNPHDAIASVGNFLKMHGWRPDDPSHVEAVIGPSARPAEFVAPSLKPLHTVAEIQAAGIAQASSRLAPWTRASLIDLPEEDDNVAYWFAAHNFFVITQYNRSFMYAAAVLTLAEALQTPG